MVKRGGQNRGMKKSTLNSQEPRVNFLPPTLLQKVQKGLVDSYVRKGQKRDPREGPGDLLLLDSEIPNDLILIDHGKNLNMKNEFPALALLITPCKL